MAAPRPPTDYGARLNSAIGVLGGGGGRGAAGASATGAAQRAYFVTAQKMVNVITETHAALTGARPPPPADNAATTMEAWALAVGGQNILASRTLSAEVSASRAQAGKLVQETVSAAARQFEVNTLSATVTSLKRERDKATSDLSLVDTKVALAQAKAVAAEARATELERRNTASEGEARKLAAEVARLQTERVADISGDAAIKKLTEKTELAATQTERVRQAEANAERAAAETKTVEKALRETEARLAKAVEEKETAILRRDTATQAAKDAAAISKADNAARLDATRRAEAAERISAERTNDLAILKAGVTAADAARPKPRPESPRPVAAILEADPDVLVEQARTFTRDLTEYTLALVYPRNVGTVPPDSIRRHADSVTQAAREAFEDARANPDRGFAKARREARPALTETVGSLTRLYQNAIATLKAQTQRSDRELVEQANKRADDALESLRLLQAQGENPERKILPAADARREALEAREIAASAVATLYETVLLSGEQGVPQDRERDERLRARQRVSVMPRWYTASGAPAVVSMGNGRDAWATFPRVFVTVDDMLATRDGHVMRTWEFARRVFADVILLGDAAESEKQWAAADAISEMQRYRGAFVGIEAGPRFHRLQSIGSHHADSCVFVPIAHDVYSAIRADGRQEELMREFIAAIMKYDVDIDTHAVHHAPAWQNVIQYEMKQAHTSAEARQRMERVIAMDREIDATTRRTIDVYFFISPFNDGPDKREEVVYKPPDEQDPFRYGAFSYRIMGVVRNPVTAALHDSVTNRAVIDSQPTMATLRRTPGFSHSRSLHRVVGAIFEVAGSLDRNNTAVAVPQDVRVGSRTRGRAHDSNQPAPSPGGTLMVSAITQPGV